MSAIPNTGAMPVPFDSPFRLHVDEYERNIDIPANYYEQLGIYIAMCTDMDISVANTYIEREFAPGGQFNHEFPLGEFLVQNPVTQDREKKLIPMDKVFSKCQEKEIITAPSMVFYMPEKFKKSKLAAFFQENVRLRNVIKQRMFECRANGDTVGAVNANNGQSSKKTLNNAGSGGFSSPFTILYCSSSHSALTSTCRTATSYGNACNERMLGGRRHYWSCGIIVNHLLSTIALTDWEMLKRCMVKYDLHYPTADEAMEMVRHSSDDYIRNVDGMARVEKIVRKAKPIELAAFVYMGDLFHLAKYNDSFMRGFIETLITDVPMDTELTDAEVNLIERGMDGDLKIIVSQLRPDLVGVGGNFKKVKENDEASYRLLIATVGHLQKTIGEYTLFIRALLTTQNVPPTIARMPEVLRAIGVVSDTDSTMGAAQWWSKWYCGEYTGDLASKVADTMVYIVVQNIAHLMAGMSKQLGVSDEKLFTYAMKNEYKFASFGLTTKAKHYFALITSQEGTLKSDPELELKGVALRTSNIPPQIMDEYKATVKRLSQEIADGKDVKILDVMRRVAEIEKGISDSIRSGEGLYLKTLDIKSRDSYSAESNYHYHRMYNDTFGLKYGKVEEPPYHAVRLPVSLNSVTEQKEWLANMEDRGLADLLTTWFGNEKRKYTQIIVPDSIVKDHGVPKELLDVIDDRRTVFAMVEPYYHILEVFGIFMMDKERTRLLSDYYDVSTETTIHLDDLLGRLDEDGLVDLDVQDNDQDETLSHNG